jgi:hypothetical protein
MGIESVTPEQWGWIAGILGAVGAALWKVLIILKNKGGLVIDNVVGWVKPRIERGFEGHMRLVETSEKTQIAMAGHIESINHTLTMNTELLKKIDQQTCPSPPESNA